MKKLLVFLIILCIIPVCNVSADSYADITGHWSEPYIASASDMGFITIAPGENFSPDSPITLAELLSMLVPLVDGKRPETSFADDNWHSEYVDKAYNLGIMNGFTKEETQAFYDSPTIRMMSNVLFANTLRCLGVSDKLSVNESNIKKSRLGLVPFYDAEEILGDLYTVSSYSLVAHGIIEGDGNSCLLPYHYLTRAQAITILVRIKRLQIRYSNNVKFVDPFSYSSYAYTCVSKTPGEVYPLNGASNSIVTSDGTIYTSIETSVKILNSLSGYFLAPTVNNPIYNNEISSFSIENYKYYISDGSVIGSQDYAGYISNELGKKYTFDFSKGKKTGMFIGTTPVIPLKNVLDFYSVSYSDIKTDEEKASVIIEQKGN